MPDYAQAKIYKITHPAHELPYIGSTTQPLSKRLGNHRSSTKLNCNRCRSRILFETEGAQIELIESYPCTTQEQLLRREGDIIRATPCINRCISGRTAKEYKADNREKNMAYNANYRKVNRGKIYEYLKTKHSCECGSTYTNRDRAKHMRTQRHIRYVDASRALKDSEATKNVIIEQNELSSE
jgi:hypothetical protein